MIFKILVHRKPGVSLNAILQSHSPLLFSSSASHWNLRLADSVRQSGQQVPRSAWPCLLSSGITATRPHAFLVGTADETQISTHVQQALSWLNNLPQALKKMLIKFYISLCQVCKCSLYILHNSSLSDLSFANRFFQSVSCLLILFLERFLILNNFILPSVSFRGYTWKVPTNPQIL